MLLKSLKLWNFRQYKGNQEIAFSTDKDRNVTIVLGKNTGGKTTLVQAFNWVLYDNVNFDDKVLLNFDIQESMLQNTREKVSAEMELIHDNVNYTIKRMLFYSCDYNGNIKSDRKSIMEITYKDDNGNTIKIPASEHNNTIEKILPSSLSDYFFFDGERIENISTRKDVSEAVKGLMGLSVLEAARNHLNPSAPRNSVYGKFKSQLDLGKNNNADIIQKNLEKANKNKEEIEKRIDEVKDEIEYYSAEKYRLAQELRDNEQTAEFQKQKEKIERLVFVKENELNKLEDQVVADFNNEPYAFFSQLLIKKATDILSSVKDEANGIPGMNIKAIEHLIKRGTCICGAELRENSESLTNVIKEMQLLPPNSIGTIVRKFTDKMEIYNSVNERYYKNVIDKYKELRECKKDIGDMEYELKSISTIISGSKDMKVIEEKFNNTKYKLKELENKKDNLLKQKGAYDNEINRWQREYDSLAAILGKNKKVLQYMNYTKKIYEWFDNTYQLKESEIRDKLTNKVNSIFCKMYHGRRKVTIDSKYRVNLLTSLGDKDIKTDESRGLETVKNFAFITGLVDLAREKISGGDDMEEVLSSEPYPIVMDAPFSNADEIHVSNISKILPEIAEQVIMVVMKKDWDFAEPTMGGKVAKKYILDKQSETLTYIKEV